MPQSQAKNLSLIAAIDLGSNSFHMVVAKAGTVKSAFSSGSEKRFNWPPASTKNASSTKNPCSAGSTASSASPN